MTYGKLTNGKVEYFKPYRGGILVGDKIVFTKSIKYSIDNIMKQVNTIYNKNEGGNS